MALWTGEDASQKKDNKKQGGNNVRVIQPLAGGQGQNGMTSMGVGGGNPYNPAGMMAPGLPMPQSSLG